MDHSENIVITVQTTIDASVEKVWIYWNTPQHIIQWCFASNDWHAPYAKNDLRVGGQFKTTMAAKDGSMSFDFEGVYDEVQDQHLLAYTIGDGRQVKIIFQEDDGQTTVLESFEAEGTHPIEMQREGWQAILDNFKQYTETH